MLSGISKIKVFNNDTVVQGMKYLMVGGICTLFDFSLLYLLFRVFKLYYVLSSAISFMSSSILNYLLCTLWIFKIRVVENRSLEMFYYLIISGVGLTINTLLVWGFTELLSLFVMISKVLATIVTFVWNFGARKYLLHNIKRRTYA